MADIVFTTRLTEADWDDALRGWRCPALAMPGAGVVSLFIDGIGRALILLADKYSGRERAAMNVSCQLTSVFRDTGPAPIPTPIA